MLVKRLGRWVQAGLLASAASVAQTAKPADANARQADRLFRSGSTAFAAGDLSAAHVDFARLVRLAPQVGAAHTAYGVVLLAQGQAEAAVAELEQARRLDPQDERVAINLGVAYHQLGQNSKAVQAFAAATAKGAPLTVSEAIADAGALVASGDAGRAQAVIEDAVRREPSSALLQDALGVLSAQRGEVDSAKQRFEQAITLDAGLPAAHAHLGSLLLMRSDPQHAITEFATAQRLGDRSPALFLGLGRALSQAGQDVEAVAALRQAAAMPSPQQDEARYALALALQNAGDSTAAAPIFRDLVARQPENTGLLTNYGLALMQTGDAKGALAMYRRAHDAGDASATLREDMGAAYLQQNNIDRAIEQFRAGLAVDPENVQLHYDLGLAYKFKDDIPAAAEELKYAAELDPQLPDPHYTLGVLEMQRGDFVAARVQLEQTVALQPANGDAWSLLGSVDKQAGDNGKAAEALRHAIGLLPLQPSPHITLAAILSEQGDKDAALAERRIAAQLTREAASQQQSRFALESGQALLARGQVNDAIVQLKAAVAATPALREAHLTLAEALTRAGRTADALEERQKAEALARP